MCESNLGEFYLLHSIEAVFEPPSWRVPTVKVLRSATGEPLAFYALAGKDFPTKEGSIPEEFFSHEMRSIDYKDADKFAEFMSLYGLFRWGNEPKPYATWRLIGLEVSNLDPSDSDSVDRFEELYGFEPCETMMMNSGDRSRQEFYSIFKPALLKLLEEIDSSNRGKDPLAGTVVSSLVSIWQAQHAFENWLYASDYIKALLVSHSITEIAKRVGVEEDCVLRNAEGAMNIINREIECVSPRVEVFNKSTGENLNLADRPRHGSVQTAIALQLWKMSVLGKEGVCICKECGDVFVTKQSKTRKGAPRSNSLFCCDKCKNRYTQRQHRKSAGYRLKQDKKRASTHK